MKTLARTISVMRLITAAAVLCAATVAVAADSLNMRLVGSYATSSVSDIYVHGSHAYLTSPDSGLTVLDVSDPAHPVRVNRIPIFPAQYVHGNERTLVVSVPDTMVAIYDISDPGNPVLASTYGIRCKAVHVNGAYAYLIRSGDFVSGGSWINCYLEVVDIANPAAPMRFHYIDLRSPTDAAAIDDAYAYSYYYYDSHFGPFAGCFICEISGPNSIQFAKSWWGAGGSPWSVTSRIAGYDRFAYLSPRDSVALVYEKVDTSLMLRDTIIYPVSLADMKKVGSHYAVACNQNAGVWLYDMQTPTSPAPIAFYQTPDSVRRSYYGGKYIYAVGSGGLQILQQLIDTVPPSTPQLISPPIGAVLPDSIVEFAWHASIDSGMGIRNYILEVSADTGFQVKRVLEVADTTVSISLPDTMRFWRVTAVDEVGNQSTFTEVRTFSLDGPPAVPALQAPIGGQWLNTINITLQCSTIVKALGRRSSQNRYVFQLDTISAFTPPLFADTTVSPCDTMALPEGKYYWRAKCFDSLGRESAFTPCDSFGVDTTGPEGIPTLCSPQDRTVLQAHTVVFNWHRVSDALSGIRQYTLQYSYDSTFTSPVTITTTDTLRAITFDDDPVLFWHLTATDKASNQSQSSVDWQLNVDCHGPETCVKLAPPDHSTQLDSTVTFAWSRCVKSGAADALPVKYYVSMSRYEAGAYVPCAYFSTWDTASTLVLGDGYYEWQVVANDSLHVSPYTVSWYVTVDTRAPSVQWIDSIGFRDIRKNEPVPITAQISDADTMIAARLLYRKRGGSWDSVVMANVRGGYRGDIPTIAFDKGQMVELEYCLRANDHAGHTTMSRIYQCTLRIEPGMFMCSGPIPNPTTGNAALQYQLPEPMAVTIEVYNIAGQRIRRYFPGLRDAGYHTQWLNMHGSSAGIYFYRITAGPNRQLGRFMLVH